VNHRELGVAGSLVLALALAGLTVPAHATLGSATCNGLPATIIGTDGPDHLSGTSGDDVVWLGPGSDRFHGSTGDDTVCGGPGQDALFGDSGDDWLDGDAGDDLHVVGGPGNDIVHGGAGNDLELRGDALRQDDGADQVYGDAGDDSIHGEPGVSVDAYHGGDGHDVLDFYKSGDGVFLSVGAGFARGMSRLPTVGVDSLDGFESYVGSEFGDKMFGSTGHDVINGREGNDWIEGRQGNDTLSAQSGIILGRFGHDTYRATEAGTHHLKILLGKDDDTAILDQMYNTLVNGGPGNDTIRVPTPRFVDHTDGTHASLVGNAGRDVLTFATSSRRVRISVAGKVATWGLSRVTFRGLQAYRGSPLDDVLLGSPQRDILSGLGGQDLLRGGPGNDELNGGADRDTAFGDAGRDTCSAEVRHSCELR
jgi:Ca2+-binding RTX toxin-like protein